MIRRNGWLGLAFAGVAFIANPVSASVKMGPYTVVMDGFCNRAVVYLNATSETNMAGTIYGYETGNTGDCASINGFPIFGSYNPASGAFSLMRTMDTDPLHGLLLINYAIPNFSATIYKADGSKPLQKLGTHAWHLE